MLHFSSHNCYILIKERLGWYVYQNISMAKKFVVINIYHVKLGAESLRLLSLHDNKYLRYFKGHHDRHSSFPLLDFFHFHLHLITNNLWIRIDIFMFDLLGLSHLACALEKIILSLALLIELFCFGIKELRNVRWRHWQLDSHLERHVIVLSYSPYSAL